MFYTVRNMKSQKSWRTLVRVFLLVSVATTLGCDPLDQDSGSESGTNVVEVPSTVLPPLTTPDRTICDPFNTSSPSARDRGLIANMTYLSPEMPHYNHVHDYIDYGNIIESTLYFDRMYVPTRKFDLGFTTQSGQLILNTSGQAMYEYFGLRIESQLQLASNEPEGDYQLAILSDDGAVFSWKNSDGSETEFINNDGDHPTRMACASQPVHIKPGDKLPFILEYYQGPRYHISLVVMWRPWSATAETECGQSGNSRYFDYNVVPSAPKPLFYEMLARGWKVLENENYYFPAQASNPCVPEEAPLSISSFSILSSTRNSVTATWTSNIDSYDQLEVRNITTGVITRSTVSTTASTAHTVTVTGLTPNTLYAVTGISTTDGGQVARSDERALRTPR